MTNRQHEAVLELNNWVRRGGTATNFTALLYTLIAKADWENSEKLRIAFPEEVWAYDKWMGLTAQEAEEFLTGAKP